MPNQPKTPNRAIRVDDELWGEFGQVCEDEGTNRTEELRAYMRRKVAQWKRPGRDPGSLRGRRRN